MQTNSNNIYLNEKIMQQIQDEALKENPNLLENYMKMINPNLSFDEFYLAVPYHSSSYIIFTKNYKVMDEVEKQILAINENFKIKTGNVVKENLLNVRMQNIVSNTLFPAICYMVIFILILMIYYYRITKDKKDFAYLKANGINHTEKIIFYESLLITLSADVLSIIFLKVIEKQIQRKTPGLILFKYTFNSYIALLIISLLIVLGIYILSKQVIKKINTSVLVRSK